MGPRRRAPLSAALPLASPAPSAGGGLARFRADSQLSDPSPWQPPTRVRLPMRRREGGAGPRCYTGGVPAPGPAPHRPNRHAPEPGRTEGSRGPRLTSRALCQRRPDVRRCPRLQSATRLVCCAVRPGWQVREGTEETRAGPGLRTRGSPGGTEGCGYCRPRTSSGMRPCSPLVTSAE